VSKAVRGAAVASSFAPSDGKRADLRQDSLGDVAAAQVEKWSDVTPIPVTFFVGPDL
jgi:hypothetical protein